MPRACYADPMDGDPEAASTTFDAKKAVPDLPSACVRKRSKSPFSNARVDTHAGPFRRPTAPSLRQPYRLTVMCHISDSKAVADTLKGMFNERGLILASLRRNQTSMTIVRVTAMLTSTLAGRAALLQIVNELATKPSIWRLQWEALPNF